MHVVNNLRITLQHLDLEFYEPIYFIVVFGMQVLSIFNLAIKIKVQNSVNMR